MKRYIILLMMLSAVTLYAQTDRQHIRLGNKQYRKRNYDKAEVEYSKALEKNKRNSQALYNMGCVMLQKEGSERDDSVAISRFLAAAKEEKDKKRRAKSYHNIGFVFQIHEDYAQAIEAYKEALRCNPRDNETRYNLALCQKLLKKQGGGGNNNKDEKKEKQDKNEDKQQNEQQKQEQQKKPKENKMSKENAEQLLNAAMQEEKNTQQRMQKAKQQPRSKNLQKNW